MQTMLHMWPKFLQPLSIAQSAQIE